MDLDSGFFVALVSLLGALVAILGFKKSRVEKRLQDSELDPFGQRAREIYDEQKKE